jgi:uncharacterized protein
MNKQKIINKITEIVKKEMNANDPGHDWWHIYRVNNLAKEISKKEKANLFIVELAALLHDIADWKFNNLSEEKAIYKTEKILLDHDVPNDIATQVCDIVATISYKGAGVSDEMKTIEGEIVQDADRLDAMGAIGIARAFTYGGYKKYPMFDPNIKPVTHKTKTSYMKNQGTTINHFYEKLLLLADRMKTNTGRELAKKRHKFLKIYLKEFFTEWEGEVND